VGDFDGDAASRGEAVSESLAHLAGWECSARQIMDCLEMTRQVALVIEDAGNALAAVAVTMAGTPAHSSIPDRLHDIAVGIASQAQAAAELENMFEVLHETELAAVREPRPEGNWDLEQ
jgi:hypothetical protein